MSKIGLREIGATLGVAGAAAMGVGAYDSHEAAGGIRSSAKAALELPIKPLEQANLQGSARLEALKEDRRAISLLGMSILLAAGTPTMYAASRSLAKTRKQN